ncbi:LytR/AlgR family response regulator transcription factor [Aquimarina aggregata]|nr:LytTR family DNA-binding domain-containing protein [Aquimarina aggregata]
MMNCIIIDDEPLAHKVIKNYSENLSFLNIVATFHTAVDAIGFLNDNTIDLIFLDINMPKLKGLDFLRILDNPPIIIITTAYQEFALEGYELDVLDYLLKPFSFERFVKSTNKALQRYKVMNAAQKSHNDSAENTVTNKSSPETIFIKSDKKTHQIRLDKILYLESYGSYVKIHLENEVIVTLDRLKNFETSLPKAYFLRIHKSYIVSIANIQTIEGNRLLISQTYIPIGSVYKHNINRIIK